VAIQAAAIEKKGHHQMPFFVLKRLMVFAPQ